MTRSDGAHCIASCEVLHRSCLLFSRSICLRSLVRRCPAQRGEGDMAEGKRAPSIKHGAPSSLCASAYRMYCTLPSAWRKLPAFGPAASEGARFASLSLFACKCSFSCASGGWESEEAVPYRIAIGLSVFLADRVRCCGMKLSSTYHYEGEKQEGREENKLFPPASPHSALAMIAPRRCPGNSRNLVNYPTLTQCHHHRRPCARASNPKQRSDRCTASSHDRKPITV